MSNKKEQFTTEQEASDLLHQYVGSNGFIQRGIVRTGSMEYSFPLEGLTHEQAVKVNTFFDESLDKAQREVKEMVLRYHQENHYSPRSFIDELRELFAVINDVADEDETSEDDIIVGGEADLKVQALDVE